MLDEELNPFQLQECNFCCLLGILFCFSVYCWCSSFHIFSGLRYKYFSCFWPCIISLRHMTAKFFSWCLRHFSWCVILRTAKALGTHVTVVAVFVGTFFIFCKCYVFQCPLRCSVWFYTVYEKKSKIFAILNWSLCRESVWGSGRYISTHS